MKTKEEVAKRYENLKFRINYPVLDIGGGEGAILNYAEVKEAIIIDLTETQNPNYTYIKADISKKLPELNKKFGTIFVMEVLEHLYNPLYLLAQVYDLLDDNGVCYISVPYTKLNTPDKFRKENFDNGHVSRWKYHELKNQLSKLGFNARLIQKRRRFKNLAFWLPYCWMVWELSK